MPEVLNDGVKIVAVLGPLDSAQIPREVGQSPHTGVRWGKIGYVPVTDHPADRAGARKVR
jgi:hypothetical protein